MESKTKCIVLGETPETEKKKPIEFVKNINENNGEIRPPYVSPSDFKNIELIMRGTIGKPDVMFAYLDDRSDGCLYLGHWNDGIVE